MQIQTIAAKNFKSLVDFRLDLAKFNCLIGLNGAGKSTVLQFIDFLGQQARGNIEGWLKERRWRAKDLTSSFIAQTIIDFSVVVTDCEGHECVTWKGSFDSSKLYCTAERVFTPTATLEVEGGFYTISDRANPNSDQRSEPILFRYEGSILSQLKDDRLPEPLAKFKSYIRDVTSLDLLSPSNLRQRTRSEAGSLGLGGQHLAAFLHELGGKKRHKIASQLKKVYTQLESVHSRSLPSGWKQLEITEAYQGRDSGLFPQMTTKAQHVNDGMLRLIAILAELETEAQFLLFDEIENGINPEIVEWLVRTLLAARQQVLVTTHSPMILNYLEDRVALASVIYLYKTRAGHTKAIRFFSLPSLASKLAVMGPGEVFADTDLTALAEEIAELSGVGRLSMYFLFSGEGPTDLGVGTGTALVCEGAEFLHGPMAIIVDQIVEGRQRYSLLDTFACGIVSEHSLAECANQLKAAKKSIRLPGEKQPKETRYFFNNSRVLARIAKERQADVKDDVVAILFRDSDGTSSAGRGLWEDKRRSMLHGFDEEGFARGVPMIPKPKSEAWLICGLTGDASRGGDALEEWSGNDNSPKSLKRELEQVLGRSATRDVLCDMLRDRRIDCRNIGMPSFDAFVSRLAEVI